MSFRMPFDTIRAHEFETDFFCTKVGDRLVGMFRAWDIIAKVSFHIVDIESFVHLNC